MSLEAPGGLSVMTDPNTGRSDIRAAIRACHRAPEGPLVSDLAEAAALSDAARAAIVARAADWVRAVRAKGSLGLMESVLSEYGLDSEEGLALMTLAEALLRVPDATTADALVADKIAPGDWAEHIGHSASRLVDGATLGLALTGRVIGRDDAQGVIQRATRRLGAPVIRQATRAAMRQMGRQFVLGETIEDALSRARAEEAKGRTYSYDMLGEAAMTAADAGGFFDAYRAAIHAIAKVVNGRPIEAAPGISIKLSALHPRYEAAQRTRVIAELVPRVADLARAAAAAGIGLNIDAEEQDRLDLSLDVIEAVATDAALDGWDGFGVVVQAYGRRALPVIDWLGDLSSRTGRRLMVRLVKGAYWDTEVKHAQVEGLADFPVFTAKGASDVSYLACARKLIGSPRLYPQFATHNAHTIAAVLHMAREAGRTDFELQRLHGMGAALHDHVAEAAGAPTRIYAPVGRHRELLAYLVRRLLENGANSSFVNRLADPSVAPEDVVADPFDVTVPGSVTPPAEIFAPRRNSRGWELNDVGELAALDKARAPWRKATWTARAVLTDGLAEGDARKVISPSDPSDIVGTVHEGDAGTAARAAGLAEIWDAPPSERAAALRRAADLYEEAHGEVFALLSREAGKTLPDAVAELREAVDFLRCYADEAERLSGDAPRGVIAAISPWNFPLAIFTGQIAAALAAGNAVIAKPADPTPLIGALGVRLMHRAGVPRSALQFLPGRGRVVGEALTECSRVAGLAFTGSTGTALAIHRRMAEHLDPHALLVAETGGLNAMIVDSTALPEQAVRDAIASAFQSAGQRCSAARILYVQEDVAEDLLKMLKGAMDELSGGDPWDRATDLGPIITETACKHFEDYARRAEAEGRLIHRASSTGSGNHFAPVLIRVAGIADMAEEVFGPVLHVATFPAGGLDAVVDAVNARGFGLTMGLHSRIEAVARRVEARARVGNLYVNRNQIGAIVGSQPFGGEGLSGTGPKAGGPAYLPRFHAPERVQSAEVGGPPLDSADVQDALDALRSSVDLHGSSDLPGPTGERNRLRRYPRMPILCLGPGAEAARAQAEAVRAVGGIALAIAPGLTLDEGVDGTVEPEALTDLDRLGGVMRDGTDDRPYRRALAAREGAILPLLTMAEAGMSLLERHTCADTTAAGGNASLLAGEGV
ncbi:bifunctional proline dehydrogenase/L-glutamate gamma-semialdehyde dehydrogenase PutA [Jannaschia aquimarina]|uniref:Bifunctional protein PutA n=1 Tax=Jannaschia aquimarina TaxID=935700 RepID=A0A0D1EGW9_9RHOB|nr:bifunctional proline dehydrogenase/L-glutamate gamma-semialdehyde dehydrogenase PutA [Jannaschia aquimarina]KIT16869.1 Bifunctional protein PutA [Jannaschia aquimarina]SNT12680.1 L-proline dehydrogenase /delta-1-pyrroline-5-carboxylate dehydrogenase [Jannaschia aquimarina]